MVKLLTKLINNTNKELAIYEQSSNGAQTRVALTPTTTDVRPQHVATTTPTTNYVSENSRSTPELPYFYEYCVDPNDSYATIRIWCGMKAVLSVSSDEAIDYRTITIGEVKDGVFEKQLERRNVKKKPASTFGQLLQPPRSSKDAASTSEGDASNKKDLFFKNFFRPHK
ncbi:unnamed protein product [Sphagnum compactum]